MKKILSFLVLLAGVTMFTACGSDDASYKATDPLDITVADVLFEAGGGEGSILVNSTSEITATTNADWLSLSVDGNKVIVSADLNDDLSGRSARIVVTDATGAVGHVTATQNGLLISFVGESVNMIEGTDPEPVVIQNKSNAEGEISVDGDWIHYEVDEHGKYTFTFDENTGSYRKGSFTITIGSISKTFYFGQWGEDFTSFVGQHTATYEDDSGNTYSKDVEIVENGTNSYLLRGLVPEGDIAFTLNPNTSGKNSEWYIAAGYKIGTQTVGSTTYTLRCVLSAYTAATGNRYYPTNITSVATNSYRMALGWKADDEANVEFGTIRNYSLSASYNTDGFIVCQFSNANSMVATYRKGIAYQFLNLRIQ